MRNIFLTVLVILSSCGGKKTPEDLLTKEKMVKVMTEVHLLESKVKNMSVDPRDSAQAVFDHYEKLLFKDLGITQDQYERSFNYYVDNSVEFEKIYNAIVDTLMKHENRFK